MTQRTIHPVGDHLVVQLHKVRDKTEAGIVIPDTAIEDSQDATVIAAGRGSRGKTGEPVGIEIDVGAEVLVARHTGAKVILDDHAYTIARSEDVLAVRT
jgi:chaperonin GroES